MRTNKGSTEWSYREGIECGNAWLGMNGGRFGELVKWTRADCSDRIPLEMFVERHLDGVIEEAEEQGEYFDCGRFVRGFHDAVVRAKSMEGLRQRQSVPWSG